MTKLPRTAGLSGRGLVKPVALRKLKIAQQAIQSLEPGHLNRRRKGMSEVYGMFLAIVGVLLAGGRPNGGKGQQLEATRLRCTSCAGDSFCELQAKDERSVSEYQVSAAKDPKDDPAGLRGSRRAIWCR